MLMDGNGRQDICGSICVMCLMEAVKQQSTDGPI